MIPRSRNRAFAALFVTGVFSLSAFHASTASAAMLGLEADTALASAGDSVAVNLIVSDLGDLTAPSVGAFNVNIVFDLAALSFESYSLGALLGNAGALESVDISTGVAGGNVGLGEVSFLSASALDALQPASFVLATLTFSVLDLAPAQTTLLELTPTALLSNAAGAALPLNTLAPAVITGRTLVSTPVNAPATLLLILAAALTQCRALGRKQASTL